MKIQCLLLVVLTIANLQSSSADVRGETCTDDNGCPKGHRCGTESCIENARVLRGMEPMDVVQGEAAGSADGDHQPRLNQRSLTGGYKGCLGERALRGTHRSLQVQDGVAAAEDEGTQADHEFHMKNAERMS
ncbi:expressed unknown protein [Seminavis robusta]|uniref:Uncharacterized protein n=1 Tax=Seminavis robusta TaxID=568900 RepID=A0A9N8HJR4_9STRA|nr:expressed unknown protein [Seminavis robusta]|eukprot:Sro567_g167990.1 n/a (132) ;mRNA; r:29826-30292